MKKNIYYGVMMVAAGILSATSCTDFDNYNDARHDANPSADQTLWENISGDSELTHFASLLKKTGYDKVLSSANSYTVWAPVDGKLDLAQYENMDSAQLVLEFVKNHVADYSYGVSGTWTEPKRIRMQNDKSFDFANNGTCSFDGINVTKLNVPSSNGVMHKIDGVAQYYPNISAFLNNNAKTTALGIDSLVAYYRKYNMSYLDVDNSVIGPIVDGKQTYIDSVIVNYNFMDSKLRAYMDAEDSSYTMVLPTNEAWKAEVEKGLAYYKFKEKLPYRGLDNSGNIVDQTYSMKEIAYLKDSLAKYDLFRSLVYSNNSRYNKWLTGDQTVPTDTLLSTRRNKLSNPQEILGKQEGDKIQLSNGQAYVVSSYAAHPWEVYSPEMNITASPSSVLKVTLGTGSNANFTINNGQKESRRYSFYYVQPSGKSCPTLDISLPNVKSDTYNIYAVFAPGYSKSTNTIDTLPNQYKFNLYYAKAGDKETSTNIWRFSSDGVENPEKENKQQAFTVYNDYEHRTDASGMLLADTLLLGKMTFPVSYAGTDVGPTLQIKVPFLTAAQQKNFSREIRLISIILRPVAQDEYNANATKED